MDDLRWALAVIAVLVVGGIYGWESHRRRKKRRPIGLHLGAGTDRVDVSATPVPLDVDPQDGFDLGDLGELVADPLDAPDAESGRTAAAASAPVRADGPAGGEGMTVALTVLAPPDKPMGGTALRQALENVDMKLGSDGLFLHFGVGDHKAPKAVFVVANVVEPGTFGGGDMESLQTPGLALLMRLPGSLDAAVALELLLDVGHNLARELDAELRDERRGPLTAQAIGHLRAEVMEFERRRLVTSSRR